MDISKRRLRAGIVGGGTGAFIGSVHRIASELDGQCLVVAGALSSDPEKAQKSADAWRLERSYDSFATMAQAEAARPDGIDFVIIAAPNHMHFPVARAFLDQGIHVVCDKPMTFTLKEAEDLVAMVEAKKTIFAVTYNYTGHPAVRQARDMIKRGEIGDIRRVMVEYLQDWLMDPLEKTGQKQAAWRVDPERAGISCCVGDIGTHCENLMAFITGLEVESVCADLSTFVAGRRLDDDATVLLRMEKGARGYLSCSQVACGEGNNLNIRIYGTKAGLEWHQQEPNTLIVKPAGKPWESWSRGARYMGEDAKALTRTPLGHPEGYLEAFAAIYKMIAADIRRVKSGEAAVGGYPTVRDGLRGIQFVATTVESSRKGGAWIDMPRG